MKKLFWCIIIVIIFILTAYFTYQTVRLIAVNDKLNRTKQKLDEIHNELNYIYEKYDIKNELKEEEVIYEFRTN